MKDLIINGVICEYVKLDESIEFFCDRCKQRKISKKYAQYQINGTTYKICNGCYGKLLSEQSDRDNH